MTEPRPRLPRVMAELAEYFAVEHELGRGGSSIVYAASDVMTGEPLALKVLRPPDDDDREALARAEREAQVLAHLRHPGIIPILGVHHLSDGTIVLVMRRVSGRSLREELARRGALGVERAGGVLEDVASALGYAHAQGIVHRDVKPENIVLEADTGRALLADFGIARPMSAESRVTMEGFTIGTPTYMSPEQIDDRPLDGRSDLYSLGLVAWEMLSGRKPWEGESIYGVIYRQKHDELPPIDEIRSDVPLPMISGIEGLLAKNPNERWPTAEAFLEQLHAAEPAPRRKRTTLVLPAPAAETQRLTVPEPTPVRRSRWRRVAVAAAVLLALAVATTAMLRNPRVARQIVEAVRSATGDTATPPTRVARTRATPSSAPDNPASAPAGQAFGIVRPESATADTTMPPASRMAAADTHTRVVTETVLVAATENSAARRARADSPVAALSLTPAPRAPRPTARPAPAPAPPPAPPPTAPAAPPTPAPSPIAAARAPVIAPAPVSAARLAVKVGGVHACTITEDGRAFCWGSNARGQLGTGSTDRADAPAAVSGSARFASIEPGMSHTCALSRGGSVYCWGANEHGQLGDGTFTSRLAPTLVHGLEGARLVATGLAQSCALSGGQAWCWGDNAHGQLGDGSLQDHSAPVRVSTTASFSALALGWSHSCGLDDGGTVWCWGSNGDGQLGDGTTTDRATPVAVEGPRFTAVAAGASHTCALDTDGAAWCWGKNANGQLGDGSTTDRRAPTRVAGGMHFVALTAGSAHTCALSASGSAYCWGRNALGQLGDGTTIEHHGPVRVDGAHAYIALRAMGANTCGVTAAGESFCWGYNAEGQLGDGTRQDRDRPTYIERPGG